MSNKKQPTKVTATVDQHAKYIFDRFIIPVYDQIASIDAASANEFAFEMVSRSATGFLNTASDLDSAKDLLITYIECLYKDLENERKGAGILAEPMGKPA